MCVGREVGGECRERGVCREKGCTMFGGNGCCVWNCVFRCGCGLTSFPGLRPDFISQLHGCEIKSGRRPGNEARCGPYT